jgi:hypothetical protein
METIGQRSSKNVPDKTAQTDVWSIYMACGNEVAVLKYFMSEFILHT